ncbi:glycosyltransferase [Roseivirga misakiensis]|uniref:Glycosyl transferase family 1 domain-containing protein n=1 Tax=Roseivirga misakiensis TaxID=1563681 RepID=A0A1E5T1E7_9BACT|nr:glycosyltransferase [Roseivirga misakiensis]OEK05202.1 hypothetical protein BFP71_17515 [Roseivirga misakiensis]
MSKTNAPIKIAHILYSGQGGLGTYFQNFVRIDKKRRFQHFAFFYGIEPLYEEYETFCQQHQITYQYLRRNGKLDFAAFKACKSFIKKNEITYALLHTFSLSPFYWRIRRYVKVISIDHTPYQVKTRLEWIYTALNHLLAFKAIYFYRDQFQLLKSKFPFLKIGAHTSFLPKTVDIDIFKPQQLDNESGRPFTIGTTARIIQGKRHDLLIEAVKYLKDQGQTIHLRIAGDGPNLNTCQELVAMLGLHDQVEFTGRLTSKEILHFYQSLDAYAHASEGETVCYCIMEAQACGLTILASDVEGINNVIMHGEDGFLFENEVTSVANALLEISLQRVLLPTMAEKSRLLAEDNYWKHNPVDGIASLLI